MKLELIIQLEKMDVQIFPLRTSREIHHTLNPKFQ